jgi:hypothetical protein
MTVVFISLLVSFRFVSFCTLLVLLVSVLESVVICARFADHDNTDPGTDHVGQESARLLP